MNKLAPVVLSGWGVQLEPLAPGHLAPLQQAVADGDVGGLYYVNVPPPDGMAGWIDHALAMADAGRELPFVVIANDRVVGATRYYDINLAMPTLAIGYTFHAASVWRTHVNTANKRLLLGHAFGTLHMRTVYLHTSHANLRSQAAIERLGAHRDGVLRQDNRHKDGSLRDTVCYSILDSEWAAMRARLDARLARS